MNGGIHSLSVQMGEILENPVTTTIDIQTMNQKGYFHSLLIFLATKMTDSEKSIPRNLP
jgi:hypothetical protein